MKRKYIIVFFIILIVTLYNGCKNSFLTNYVSIEKQWVEKGRGDSISNTIYDISVTRKGYMIVAKQSPDIAKAVDMPEDTYFYVEDVIIPITVVYTGLTSGYLISNHSNGDKIYPYHSLTDSTLVLISANGEHNLAASATKVILEPFPFHQNNK